MSSYALNPTFSFVRIHLFVADQKTLHDSFLSRILSTIFQNLPQVFQQYLTEYVTGLLTL